MARWVEGKSVEEAASISAPELMAALGGLPLGKEQNAIMAVQSLHYAIDETDESARVPSPSSLLAKELSLDSARASGSHDS